MLWGLLATISVGHMVIYRTRDAEKIVDPDLYASATVLLRLRRRLD
jgi:hypothetical protein